MNGECAWMNNILVRIIHSFFIRICRHASRHTKISVAQLRLIVESVLCSRNIGYELG